jgi:tRNA dimethylallyltransferase
MKTIKEKPKVIVVVGPTGSGKTKLAIKLAKCLNGELINCDAFQVYKEIKAGTAQVTKKELNGVKIHLSATVSIFSE